MKKTITLWLFAIVFLTNNTWAQPVITNLVSAPMNTKTYGHVIPGTIIPGAAGANQTWDYSTIPYNAASYYFKAVDYAGLSQALKDSFPTGNVGTEYYIGTSLVTTLVHRLEPTAFLYLGLGTLVYATPDTQLVFPHSYQETHAGFLYDAYGTLITPFGTFNNVVRLREIVANDYKYNFWQFAPEYKLLMEYKVDMTTQAVSGQTFYDSEVPTPITKLASDSELKIFPNPAVNELYIEPSFTGKAQIEIYDLQGKKLTSQSAYLQVNTPYKVDLSSIGQGVYLITTHDGVNTYSKKITIQ